MRLRFLKRKRKKRPKQILEFLDVRHARTRERMDREAMRLEQLRSREKRVFEV